MSEPTMTPRQLVAELSTRLTQAGIPLDPIDPDGAEAAATHLIEAFGLPAEPDSPQPEHALEAGSVAEHRPPVRSHSPTELVAYAHQVLSTAGLQPRWPADIGHRDDAVRAADQLQLALGVAPRTELADIIDRIWDEHDV